MELILDDSKVKALLVAHGKTAQLEPSPEWPGPFRLHAVWADADNYYAATRFYGYLLPQDNGYRLAIISRNETTPELAATIVRVLIGEGQDQSAPFFSEFRTEQPDAN